MPPKQKQAKKGPVYKAPVAFKDLVPSDIKQPWRQLKSLKYPQSFPQAPKNDKKPSAVFESWPGQQVIKAFDFGINSQNRFQDSQHEIIAKHIQNPNIISWKPISQIQKLKSQHANDYSNNPMKSANQDGAKSAHNIQFTQRQDKEESQQGTINKDPVVIQTYERDETHDQIQIRVKQQAQKAQKAAKDKKKAKKQQPKQQGPIKVRDVRMADVRVEDYMAQEAIWIGSQLQIIKLRNLADAYNRQPVWKKIYPQENGVPQITKSGKYWVKLYFMGQPVKIQVDDRLPINYHSRQMLAFSQKRHQKWTLILSKALLKYMALAFPQQKIAGNGLVFHALTGMITQSISLQSNDLQRFESLLSDSHYTKKDIFVSCYTKKLEIPPSNYMKHPSQAKQFFMLQESRVRGGERKSSAQNLQMEQDNSEALMQKQQADQGQTAGPIQPNILPGYSYLLGDYFANGQFNMAFSKQKSLKQIKLRIQYNNLSKVNLNNKTREEKLDHRRKKKQIKELLAIEEKKCLDLINEEKKQYHFIKVLNRGIKIRCQFQQKQILLAKKCRLNKLKQPPNYELPQAIASQKQDSKSLKSFSLIKITKQQTEVNLDIDDFSMVENVVDLLARPEQGTWIKDIDFLSCFTDLQIVYNPAGFHNKCIQKINSAESKSFTFDQAKEILVIQKMQMDQQGHQAENIELLFGFSYQQNYSDKIGRPHCILQKFDFDQFSVTSNVTELTGRLESSHLTLKNQNNVFKVYTMCKGSYCYWVSSNAKFKLMSISQYLEDFEGYKKKKFNLEFPALEGSSYFPIARFGVKQGSNEKNSVVLKVNTQNQELIKSLSYNLVRIPKQSGKYVSLETQGVIRKQCERKYLAIDYTRLSIEPNQQYDLVLQSCPQQNMPQGSCQVIALIKEEPLFFEYLEQVQPVRFVQKYKPNKYGLVFRERIFSSTISKQSFLVKIVQGQQVQSGAGDKKNPKKGGKQQTGVQYIQRPLQKQRTIIVRVIKNKQIIYQEIGANCISISDIHIQRKSNEQCFLEAHFDLRQWPQARMEFQGTAKICWVVCIFGSDSVALVRDTRQQQKQKETRKSWQDQQPGRAQRAKKSRMKFLIADRKQKGQDLTQQQEQILNCARLTKKQQLQEQRKNEDKSKKGGKKEEKKAGKDVKKQQAQEKPVQIIFPKSTDNCNCEIRNFLKTLQNFSVKTQWKPRGKQARIRSDQELRAIKESQKMSDENRTGKMLKNIERRQTIKLKQRDKKDHLLLQLQQLNTQFRQSWAKYQLWVNQDIQKDKSKQDKQRTIVDILKQEKPTLSQADLDKIISEYQQMGSVNDKLYDVAVMVKKNIKISALCQKIQGHLTGWEVEQLKSVSQQIKAQKVEGIPQSVLKDMKTMLQEVQKNPAILQQKQNQAKKAKKGGKK